MSTLGSVILEGTFAALPTPSIPGRLYFATDTQQTFRDNGTSWDNVTDMGFNNPMTTEGDVIYGGASGVPTRLGAGTSGQVLTTAGTGGPPTWGTIAGTGTVTSVAVTVPARQSVSGSPITSSGTLAITDNTQTANEVFASPTSGSAAAPTFRALVPADLPVATTGSLGVVKPDGTTITISSGTISAVTSGTVTAVSVATANGFQGTSSGGTTPALSINVDGTHYLPTTTDETNWNGKQAAGNYITALTGDVTAAGPGSSAATVVKVNGGAISTTGAVQKSNGSSQIVDATAGTDYVKPAVNVLTDASTVAINWATASTQTLLMTSAIGSTRTLTFSGTVSGGRYTLLLQQPASGGPCVVVWPTVKWAGATVPTLSTAASDTDIVSIANISSTFYGVGSLNFA